MIAATHCLLPTGAQRRRSIKKEKDKSMRKTLIATVLRRSCFPGLCTTAAGTPTRQSRRQYTRRELS